MRPTPRLASFLRPLYARHLAPPLFAAGPLVAVLYAAAPTRAVAEDAGMRRSSAAALEPWSDCSHGRLLLSEVREDRAAAEDVLWPSHEEGMSPGPGAAGSPAAASGPFVLICGLDHANVAEEEQVFRAAGVRFGQVVARTEDDLLCQCGEADALLIQYGLLTRRVIEGLPRLRLLVRYGVGVDGVDL